MIHHTAESVGALSLFSWAQVVMWEMGRYYMYVHAQSCPTVCTPWTEANQAFPDKNTGVGCPFLLQRIFPPRGSNPHLLHRLHWQADFFTTWANGEAHERWGVPVNTDEASLAHPFLYRLVLVHGPVVGDPVLKTEFIHLLIHWVNQ